MLLGLATVLAVVGVTEAWRTARSNHATAASVIRDYGEVAAWTFGERASLLFAETIERSFGPIWRSTGSSSNSLPYVDAAGFRRHAQTDECSCGNIYEAAYHFRLPLHGAAAEFAGRAPSAALGSALVAAIHDDVPGVLKPDTSTGTPPIGVVSAAGETVIYTVQTGEGVEPTAWGFSLDPEAVSDRVGGIMTSCSLLPPVLIDGRTNAEVVAVELIAPDREVLFAAGTVDDAVAAEHPLVPYMSDLVVRASVLPTLAGDLIIGGLPRSRVPLMVGVFALAAILAGVAVVQMRRGQELARLRSDFVAGVSHELRTPLAQIRIYADTLAMGRAEAEDRRAWSVTGLRRETTRLEHLVDNILQFARASAPADPAVSESIDVSSAIGSAVDAFRPLAARRATLDMDAAPGLRARIPAEAVQQMVGNLLDNAIKYGPRGQTIRVSVRRDGGVARIRVDDEGPGIPLAERDAVWQMYHRGRSAGGTGVGGSGIGLAVVRRIAAAHGGRTRIEEAPAGGARVVVELPVEPAPAVTAPASQVGGLVAAAK